MCDGSGECLSECNCRYMKGTNDCHCFNFNHSHLKSHRHRFCLNCLLKLNGDKDADDNPCPMCRKNIDFTD